MSTEHWIGIYSFSTIIAILFLANRLADDIYEDLRNRRLFETNLQSWGYWPNVTVGRVVADALRALIPPLNLYYAVRGIFAGIGSCFMWLELTLSRPVVPRRDRKEPQP